VDADVTVVLKDLGLLGEYEVVDMWSGKNLGMVSDNFVRTIKPHASGLYKFIQQEILAPYARTALVETT
jgi:hypothetical protein